MRGRSERVPDRPAYNDLLGAFATPKPGKAAPPPTPRDVNNNDGGGKWETRTLRRERLRTYPYERGTHPWPDATCRWPRRGAAAAAAKGECAAKLFEVVRDADAGANNVPEPSSDANVMFWAASRACASYDWLRPGDEVEVSVPSKMPVPAPRRPEAWRGSVMRVEDAQRPARWGAAREAVGWVELAPVRAEERVRE